MGIKSLKMNILKTLMTKRFEKSQKRVKEVVRADIDYVWHLRNKYYWLSVAPCHIWNDALLEYIMLTPQLGKGWIGAFEALLYEKHPSYHFWGKEISFAALFKNMWFIETLRNTDITSFNIL